MLVYEKQSRSYPLVQVRKLRGRLSVKMPGANSLAHYCSKLFANFDPARFEPLAIRVFRKNEYVITVYAIDHLRWQREGRPRNYLPVKKFKTISRRLPINFPLFTELSFTLSTEDYPLAAMRVINK